MNLQETTELLAYINRATGQPVADGASAVWHDLIGEMTQAEALEAVRATLTDVTRRDRWIAPADVMAAHQRERLSRQLPAGCAPGLVSDLEAPRNVRQFLDVQGVPQILTDNGASAERFTAQWRGTACPFCNASESEPCTNSATGKRTNPHP